MSLAVDTRLQPGEQLLKQEEGGGGEKSYRVSPLGKHRYLREEVTVSVLKLRLEGSNEGTVRM